jgi:1-acyl-sn-glycerol-3-phosphate acyltransferase
MIIYIEGKRSFDGKLLPFKKGPFYLAMECGVPVIPITIVGTHYAMPKTRFAIKPAKVHVIFHPPIDPKDFGNRECLMEKVRSVIEAGLPEEYRQKSLTTEDTETHKDPL